jgi:hypothetical protein
MASVESNGEASGAHAILRGCPSHAGVRPRFHDALAMGLALPTTVRS